MLLATVLLFVCAVLPWTAQAMRQDHLARLRRETVDMFYHGFSNYMEHGFPEDEVCHAAPSVKPIAFIDIVSIASSFDMRPPDSRSREPRPHRTQRRPRKLLPHPHRQFIDPGYPCRRT